MSIDVASLAAVHARMRVAADGIGTAIDSFEGDMPPEGSVGHADLSALLRRASRMLWGFVDDARAFALVLEPGIAGAYGLRVEALLAGKPTLDAVVSGGPSQESLRAVQGLIEAFVDLCGMVAGKDTFPLRGLGH